jgi:tetratricopeptide (TPR) repeat protein
MSQAPSLESLLSAATRAEVKRDGLNLNLLAHAARQAGADALALKSALLARQRGFSEAPLSVELELLFRYEQLEPLLDLAIEYHDQDILQRIVLSFGGHPDLHRHGLAAADALASMLGAAPALPPRRAEPNINQLWEAFLAGDSSLIGWGLRRYGAPMVDRIMRLASQGIGALRPVAAIMPAWIEIQAGKRAALPYYRFAYEHRFGVIEHQRKSLILCAALGEREDALEVCRDEAERVSLATWVLGRPSEEPIDARWLRFLDEDALARFAEAEGRRWLAGDAARLQVDRICAEPRLAGSFQPWFMAMGDFPAVLACIQSRCRIAERSERVQLERAAAEMLEHLGRPSEALAHAAEALLLAPDERTAFDLVYALGRAHPAERRRACDHLLAASETAGRVDWALRSITLLSDPSRLQSTLELVLHQFSTERVLEAYDRLDEVHSSLGQTLYAILSARGVLDADRVVGFVRSRLPGMSSGDEQPDFEPLLQLLERHAADDDRSARLRIPILLELGRGDEALEALNQAGVSNQGSWAVLRARAHWLSGRSSEARELLQGAVASGNRSAAEMLETLEAEVS